MKRRAALLGSEGDLEFMQQELQYREEKFRRLYRRDEHDQQRLKAGRFKDLMDVAEKLRTDEPRLTWQQALKQA
jgi:hypothetical protein